MTCITGIEHNGKVWIGGDSAGVGGYDVTVRADEKVFVNGPCLFGFSTSFRMGQLLRYQLAVPEKPPSMDDNRFVHTLLLEAIRKTLKEFGFAKVENNEETGGFFLLGYAGHLYAIENDYQVGRSVDPFAACGCGMNYALAVLHTSTLKDPQARIIKALQTAEHFSAAVRGPFHVLSL